MKTQDLAFCSRPSNLCQQKLSYNSHGIVLKKVQSFSPIREDEVSRMIKKISQQAAASQITNLSNIVISLATTIICRVAFSISWIDKLTGLKNKLEKNFKCLDEFYEELIEQHHNSNRPKSMERDIIDLLLQLRKERSTQINLTLDNIKAILMNLFLAGTDTSAITVIWAMTALMKNPKAMKKVQE
ncbi:hypothetical protein KY289_037453 [Solanum tuberosum]|nr:hypothetical protein KY289_037453 [Solanum tuberosum]